MFTLGLSPCPNDTFIFYALLNGRIDTKGISLEPRIEDVETLNGMALKSSLDVTKVSCHVYHYVRDNYDFLASGGAFGRGCGPLIITRDEYTLRELKDKRIAIPGEMTTAYLLLKLFFRSAFGALSFEPVPMLFSGIPAAVREGRVDAGLIIHEGRFTYQGLGLLKTLDLGAWWEAETGLPIPLGGIIARKTLGQAGRTIQELIRESITYARDNRAEALTFIRRYSQELAETVINKHIDLYVNEFSIDMGEEGRAALDELLTRAGYTS
jgi:1,4-dihydroxy-6-naphthoate synthase